MCRGGQSWSCSTSGICGSIVCASCGLCHALVSGFELCRITRALKLQMLQRQAWCRFSVCRPLTSTSIDNDSRKVMFAPYSVFRRLTSARSRFATLCRAGKARTQVSLQRSRFPTPVSKFLSIFMAKQGKHVRQSAGSSDATRRRSAPQMTGWMQ